MLPTHQGPRTHTKGAGGVFKGELLDPPMLPQHLAEGLRSDFLPQLCRYAASILYGNSLSTDEGGDAPAGFPYRQAGRWTTRISSMPTSPTKRRARR